MHEKVRAAFYKFSSRLVFLIAFTGISRRAGTGTSTASRALILRLHDPLGHHKILVAPAICQEEPHAPHEVPHVDRHQVGAAKEAVAVRLEEEGAREAPLGRRHRGTTTSTTSSATSSRN